ncbi:MAG: hypothetical protein HKL79_03670 [Thermoplasmata archaeon]|nr:hypothetical protein [Thermoplasmata archaeon]
MTVRSAETAELLILVGLILQVVGVLIVFGIGIFLLIGPLIGAIFLLFAFFGIVWLILVYAFSYRRTKDGDYEGARTPTLVFAILSLLSLGLISGILYIVAYSKLGDAINEAEASRKPSPSPAFYAAPAYAGGPAPVTSAALPTAPRFCSRCGRPTSYQSRFCLSCGAVLA